MSSPSAPPLTIVTPVYNGTSYIVETVESVLAQDYRDIEYIVLDDGSTDDTAAQLERFRDRIRLVQHPNQGEAATVNRGVELASHDIVGIINADDPVLPGLFTAVGESLGSDRNLSAVYPDWQLIDELGRVVREVRTGEFDFRVLLEQHYCLPGPGAFYRRSHLEGRTPRNPSRRTSADYDFWLRLGLHGKIQRIPRTLATWRSHPAGTSSAQRNADMARDKVEVIETFFQRDDLPDVVQDMKAQAMSAAYWNAALLALHGGDVPALRYLVRSYLQKPYWPRDVLPQQRRSLAHALYAGGQPFSGWIHHLLNPLLPRRYTRAALLINRFGSRLDV
jgi:glycosyltransferase involved in cell wall biosynthesis